MVEMARPLLRAVFGLGLLIACGSRTGLGSGGLAEIDASVDATTDVEAGPFDVTVDCSEPPTCNPQDLGYVYQCGTRISACGALEQCVEGKCRNPCVDTLGQDTSNGCEFFVSELDLDDQSMGACWAVFIVNEWGTGEPARIEVDRAGVALPVEQFARIPQGSGTSLTYAPYDAKKGLAKDQVAILFLSRDPNAANDPNTTAPRRLASCPPGITPAFVGDAAIHGSGRSKAFHVKTNVPVVAYDILPYGGGRARVTGASLLLPTNVWGDGYVAVNAYERPLFGTRRTSTIMILGLHDGTTVRIKPTAEIPAGGGVLGTAAGELGTYTIDRGEYLQLSTPEEITGSPIEASAPIGVIGGSGFYNVPFAVPRADSGHQMLPPIRALGSEYVGVRYRSRSLGEESVPWRIIGAAAGTDLSWEPSTPVGAPTKLAPGQLVEFWSPGQIVVERYW